MHERERHHLIVKLVNQRSIVPLSELMELLDVSEQTVRRDITALAEGGQVKRIRGGVEALHPTLETHLVGMPFDLSQDLHVAQKRAIAQAAAQLIGLHESIIVNGGTTTFGLAEFLTEHKLHILTNSFPMAAKLLATRGHRVVVPAGEIYRDQHIILSPFEQDGLKHFWGKKLFTSGHGVHRFGLMEADPLIAQAQARLLGCAEEVIVLADSSKLGREGPLIVAPLDQLSTLITDDGATAEQLEPFEAAGLQVIVVKTDEPMSLTA